jgi:hypothetical protein
MGWRVVLVWCPLPMLLLALIVKEELNIFPLGLVSVLKTNFSPHTLTERGV